MGDLVQGLIKPKYQAKAFWGRKYIILNDNDLEDSALWRLQLTHMKIAEGNSNNKRYKNAEEFLYKASNYNQNELLDMSSSKIYSRIISLINSGLWSSENNPISSSKGSANYYEERDRKVNEIMEEMTQILTVLDVSKGLKKDILDKLEERISTMKGSRQEYVQIKADWAEELAAIMFNQDPALSAIKTGNIIDAAGQQLIEDVMAVFSKDLKVPFKGGALSVKLEREGIKQNKSVKNLQEFFDLVNKSQGFTIRISDPLYDVLKEQVAIMGQVKSGQDQPILTTAKRNAIALSETEFSNYELWQLYTVETPNRWFKPTTEQESKTLEATTNFFLSKAIAQTNIYRNQVYFTKDGIVSASRWMELNHYLLKFHPGLTKMGPNFLNKINQYRFYKDSPPEEVST